MRWENLKVGDYVAVIGHKLEFPENPWRPSRPDFDGMPFLVSAMAFPFLSVIDSFGNRSAQDFRAFEYTKVSRVYYESLMGKMNQRANDRVQRVITESKKRRRKQKERPDGTRCPRCGDRMCQRLFYVPGPEWHRFCRSCGLDAGPADDDDGGEKIKRPSPTLD